MEEEEERDAKTRMNHAPRFRKVRIWPDAARYLFGDG